MKKASMLSALGLAGLMVMGSARAEDDDKGGGCCGGGTCALEKQAGTAAAKEGSIGTAALKTLLDAKAPSAVLDARSGKYDDGRRIPGARQLSPDAEEAVITQALPDKKALIVTYCAGLKCPASKMLADRLKKLGYSNVLEYPEGIAGWAEAGNAVEQKAK